MLVAMKVFCSAVLLVCVVGQKWEDRGSRHPPRAIPAWAQETHAWKKGQGGQPSVMQQLKRKCEWIKIMKQGSSQRSKQFKTKYPDRYAKMEKECAGLLENQAHNDKESLETQCAWIATLKEMGQEETLQHHEWYEPLSQKCAGVPRAEWQDNADEILKKKCVWVELLELAGKSESVEKTPWYKGLKQKCSSEPDNNASRMKAMQMAAKLQGAASKVQSIFGALHGAQESDGAEDDEEESDWQAERGHEGRPIHV